MIDKNNKMPVSQIKGQANSYIYNILQDINKLKILLVFMNKGFTWHRELKSLGIYSNVIEQTLNEFNSLGFIELKELTELDEIQYETLKGVKQDLQHYFKIYFVNPRLYKTTDKFNEDLDFIINNNPQFVEFIVEIKRKLKPFIIKTNQIMKEEQTQLTRKVNLNGIEFEKDTIMSKEVKQILNLMSSKQGSNLILREIKPLALMTTKEMKKHTNKVFHNGKEINSSIFREIEEKEKEDKKDFETGTIGKSLTELEIDREKQDNNIFDRLGIEK